MKFKGGLIIKFKKSLILSIMLIFLVLITVSAVSADGTFDQVQSAINATTEGSTVYLNGTTYRGDGSEIAISTSNIVICGGFEGNKSMISTLDAQGKSGIFKVNSGVNNLTFIGINFINGISTDSGGAIYFSSTSDNNSWVNCTFINNNAEVAAGAIYLCSGSNNSWVNSIFNNNTAYSGGAICLDSVSYNNNNYNSWVNCFFINNTSNNGGAICFYSYSASIDNSWVNCSFINNNAVWNGGAIFFYPESINNSWVNSIFINNNAEYGGAIYLDKCSGNNVTYCIFDNNTALNGKAIIVKNFDVSNFDNNFWSTNNTITATEFNNSGLIVSITYNDNEKFIFNHVPGNFIVLNINATETGYKLYFALNGTTVDVSDKMPTYICNVKFNEANDVTNTIGTYSYPVGIQGYVYIAANSLFSGKLLADTFEILPLSLTADNLTKYFKGTEPFVVNLSENGVPLVNKTINIAIKGKTYARTTDENGTAKLNINLAPGEYTVTSSYGNLSIQNIVTVKTTIHCDDFTKYYLNGTQYEAYVLDSQGNPLDDVNVTFNINGVFYTRTAHNGIVKMNINLLPGEYIITAHNDVTGEQSSAIVTVLPTLIGSDLNMTFQDGSKYECMLVDSQGNPVKGAEVTFNIHGVFYHKITDENGIARLTINLLPCEYIITAIYNGTMTSNTITVRDL